MPELDENQVVSLLRSTEIFQGLKPEHVVPVARACRVVKFGAQSRIVRQGDTGSELFIVALGEVAVVLEDREAETEQAVLKLGPGQSFGEVSLLNESVRSATVKAIQDTVCIALAKKSFESLLRQLPELGVQISRYLAARLHQQCQLTGFRFVSESELVYDPELHKLFSDGLLDRVRAIPLTLTGGTLTVAMTRPNDLQQIQALRRDVPGLAIEPVACTAEDFEAFMSRYRRTRPVTLAKLDSLAPPESLTLASGNALPKGLRTLLGEMMNRNLSQVTLEVKEGCGMVFDSGSSAVTPFLEIQEWKRLCQEIDSAFLNGQANPHLGGGGLNAGGSRLRVEVSKLDALEGPRYSLRLSDPSQAVPTLQGLIPNRTMREQLLEILTTSLGAVLISGAARCGKTTTAYSLLQTLSVEQGLSNAISLEKEPLAALGSVSQVKLNGDWRPVLDAAQTQSPALLFVDDLTLADLPDFLAACEAGRPVLFACTTNDMMAGLEELNMRSSRQAFDFGRLDAILHQRSAPRQCPHCRTEYRPTPALLESLIHEKLADKDQLFFTSKGCADCRGSKILGRCQLFELLTLNSFLKEMLAAGRPPAAVRKAAAESGHLVPFQTLARYLLKQGDLSATEALRQFGSQR